MENKKYINFEVWKKINKDKMSKLKIKPIEETIKEIKSELFCNKVKSLKSDGNV